jgi:hypothetical protein
VLDVNVLGRCGRCFVSDDIGDIKRLKAYFRTLDRRTGRWDLVFAVAAVMGVPRWTWCSPARRHREFVSGALASARGPSGHMPVS